MDTSIFSISSVPFFYWLFSILLCSFLYTLVYPLYRAEVVLSKGSDTSFQRRIWLLISLSVLGLSFFRSAYVASDLPVSDSVEYAIASEHLYSFGTYDLTIGDQSHPPRYPIGFALFVGYPAHLLFGQDPGVAIYGVFFLTLLGGIAAFYASTLIAGPLAGGLTALLLIIWPHYRHMARIIWTDGPGAALFLIALLLYLLYRERQLSVLRTCVLTGILCLFGYLFRPTNAALSLPLLLALIASRRWSPVLWVALYGPTLLGFIASRWYQAMVFGDASRSGYHYWAANYYDYTGHLFNFSYVPTCLHHLFSGSGGIVLLLLIGGAFSVHRALKQQGLTSFVSSSTFWDALRFLLICGIPLTLFFIVYYFCWQRFFIPLQVLILLLTASIAGHCIMLVAPKTEKILRYAAGPLILVAGLAYPYSVSPPLIRNAIDRLHRLTPEHALLVTALNPVQLEPYVLRNSSRINIPISRNVEFASKTIVTRRIEDPDLENFRDPFSPALLEGGAVSPIDIVALEDPHFLIEALKNARPVFLETHAMHPDELKQFKQYFSLTNIEASLYQVEAKQHCITEEEEAPCSPLMPYPPQLRLLDRTES